MICWMKTGEDEVKQPWSRLESGQSSDRCPAHDLPFGGTIVDTVVVGRPIA